MVTNYCKHCNIELNNKNQYSRFFKGKIRYHKNICTKCNSARNRENFKKGEIVAHGTKEERAQIKIEKFIEKFTSISICTECYETNQDLLRQDSKRVYNICKKCFSKQHREIELLKHKNNPELGKKCFKQFHEICKEKVKNGTHPFQQEANRTKGRKAIRYHSYPELKLFKLVQNIFPDALGAKTATKPYIFFNEHKYFPDILIEEFNLIIEFDGVYYHKLHLDKNRDSKLIEAGYKILHYQGYLPSEDELRKDIKELVSSEAHTKYKRFNIDITTRIKNIDKYEELNLSKN